MNVRTVNYTSHEYNRNLNNLYNRAVILEDNHGRKFESVDDQTKDSSFRSTDQKLYGERNSLPIGDIENLKIQYCQGWCIVYRLLQLFLLFCYVICFTKQRRLENRSSMRQLQMKASQSIKRARALLREMETLRNQVADVDLQTFDNLMNPSRQLILEAIDMFKSNCFKYFFTNNSTVIFYFFFFWFV